MKRSAGILLPISALPSEYGIGCFDGSAYRFADFLHDAGQTHWQILPLSPTGFGDSPYQSYSVFAGNPYFISLAALTAQGLLTEEECKACDFGENPQKIDYEKLSRSRIPLLCKAFERSRIGEDGDFREFCNSQPWLPDYALFMALKSHFGGAPWNEWDEDIRLREPQAMAKYRQKLARDVQFHEFLQYCFHIQWNKLKAYANALDIRIIGDIPIYTAFDSADVWAQPQLFQLDSDGSPISVAGCPPDGFAPQGQLWGNPLYDWKFHESTGFSWWIARLAHCFSLYDTVRIDHFRGFDEYYAIPFGDTTAENGSWQKGPGAALFHAAEKALGRRDVIAEDLGFVTDSVRALVQECGFPNMKVLQFGFDSRDDSGSEHLPHRYHENCIAYSGTHDNQTLAAWISEISETEHRFLREYLCDSRTPDEELYLPLLALLLRSPARCCIIPMQDWLGLGSKARMNTPSTVGENWKWRMRSEDMSIALCSRIHRMTELYERTNEGR